MEVRDLLLSADLKVEEARCLLGGYGFRETSEADRNLQEMADLTGDRERFALLAPALLEQLSLSADPDAALVQLLRFFESVPSALNLTSYLLEDEAALEALVQVLGASPFLSEVLLRNSEYLYWLRASNRVDKVPAPGYFTREAAGALAFGRVETGLDYLRRLRRRESLRIACQDLLGKADLSSIVSQISELAEAILETVFKLLWPGPDGTGFAVMALGKLGGGELNFSSDIDLLYVYADNRDSAATVRFARAYTRALAEHTSEGSLYRVDLRLRPMGRTGEIAYPLAAYRHYYETGADTFDRLALLKCRWVAGDPELGRRFLESVEDFVFRKYLDQAAVEEIGWLKKRTDRRMKARGESARNVKLGLGGIREIEFFVQSFQILYGGSRPEIRSANTLGALDRLVDAGLVSPRDHGVLKDAYIFFRDLEHRLQLVHDLQTQTLPEDSAELERVARRMGFEGRGRHATDPFKRLLERHSSTVHQIFASLFDESDSGGVHDLILNPGLETEEAEKLLRSSGIEGPGEVLQALRQIQAAPSFPQAPTRTRNLLANLLPVLLEQCRLTPRPAAFLGRFDRVAESLGGRASFYRGLMENPKFAERLFRVLISGDFLSETLIRYPELLDSVSAPVGDASPQRLRETWTAAGGDEAAFPTALRRFKRREEFKIALVDLDSFSDPSARLELSRVSEICLRAACEHLLPAFPQLLDESFMLCAMGKLGGRELTYHSDLDLVLFHCDTAETPANLFNDFARALKRSMEEYTQEGQAYKLDFRLRPEGRHSGLATPLSAFERYATERMEAWERLAYVKLRPVFCHGGVFDPVRALPRRPFSEAEVESLHALRLRKEFEIGREAQTGAYDFKVGTGGLLDIQFVIQRLQIDHGVRATGTLTALRLLGERGVLRADEPVLLGEGLAFLSRLESASRLLAEQASNSLSRDPAECRLTARFLGFEDGVSLLERYQSVTAAVRNVYRRHFGDSGFR